ncbi:MAG: histidine kinase [Oscillospiraceae bacterium]|nr:histidine kinase [Oscillospiraceae bacterium]
MDGKKTAWPYIKRYKFNILLLKTFIYVFVLVTVPLLLVLSLNYNKFSTLVNNRVMDMNDGLLQKNAAVTDNIMTGLLDTASKASQLQSVVEIVEIKAMDGVYDEKVDKVVQDVKNYTLSNNMILSTIIYSDVNGILIDESGATRAQSMLNVGKWYDVHKKMPMVLPYILVNHSNSVFVCQPIWSPRGQRVGLLVLEVAFQQIRSVMESQETGQQGIFFVIDASGQIIYSSNRTFLKLEKQTIQEYESDIINVKSGQSQLVTRHSKRVVSVKESDHNSWKYAYVTELPDYQEEMTVNRTFLISSVTVGILTSLVVAYVITYFAYRPIRKIVGVIQNPQFHWNEREATKKSNEMLFITSNILADSDPDSDISEELGDRIRSLRQAQFRALQFQIDPHFLYNTLETIKWNAVAEMGLGNKTSKMLTKVARLYRLGLENDDVIVPLREELEFLKLYIEIVRIRFGDSIQFHWDIDESLYDCNVIKMCLQPIVENAIQHGLRPKNYLGNITVSAWYKEECLHICVEDDGLNLRQTELDKLNEKLRTGSGFEESKVGLRNVNERIKLIYGKKYGVNISNTVSAENAESGAGVRVVLTFPCRNFNRSEETK